MNESYTKKKVKTEYMTRVKSVWAIEIYFILKSQKVR